MTQQPNDSEPIENVLRILFLVGWSCHKASTYLGNRVGRKQEDEAVEKALIVVQDEILKAQITMLNEAIHQSRTNLKTSEAVAQWAEMRIATLSNQLKTEEDS